MCSYNDWFTCYYTLKKIVLIKTFMLKIYLDVYMFMIMSVLLHQGNIRILNVSRIKTNMVFAA